MLSQTKPCASAAEVKGSPANHPSMRVRFSSSIGSGEGGDPASRTIRARPSRPGAPSSARRATTDATLAPMLCPTRAQRSGRSARTRVATRSAMDVTEKSVSPVACPNPGRSIGTQRYRCPMPSIRSCQPSALPPRKWRAKSVMTPRASPNRSTVSAVVVAGMKWRLRAARSAGAVPVAAQRSGGPYGPRAALRRRGAAARPLSSPKCRTGCARSRRREAPGWRRGPAPNRRGDGARWCGRCVPRRADGPACPRRRC